MRRGLGGGVSDRGGPTGRGLREGVSPRAAGGGAGRAAEVGGCVRGAGGQRQFASAESSRAVAATPDLPERGGEMREGGARGLALLASLAWPPRRASREVSPGRVWVPRRRGPRDKAPRLAAPRSVRASAFTPGRDPIRGSPARPPRCAAVAGAVERGGGRTQTDAAPPPRRFRSESAGLPWRPGPQWRAARALAACPGRCVCEGGE